MTDRTGTDGDAQAEPRRADRAPRSCLEVLATLWWRRLGRRVALVALVLAGALPARAHWADLAVLELTARGDACEASLTLPAGLVLAGDGDGDGRITPAEATSRKMQLEASLAPRLELTDGAGARVPLSVEGATAAQATAVDPRIATDAPGTGHVTLKLRFGPIAVPQGMVLRYDLWLADAPNASCMATVFVDGKTTAHVFTPQARTLTLGGTPWRTRVAPGARQLARGEPLAFALLLALAASTASGLGALILAYLIAHSLTLWLGALDVVALPPATVAIALAASVVFVALENLLRTDDAGRAKLAAGFGLLHGLGSAAGLRALGLAPGDLGAIAGFHVGVVLAHLALYAVAAPFALAATRSSRPRALRTAGSVLALAAGALWLARALGVP